jgi:hypothetical protein
MEGEGITIVVPKAFCLSEMDLFSFLRTSSFSSCDYSYNH